MTDDKANTVEIACDVTGETRRTRASLDGGKLPPGWRRHAGKTWSGDAWKKHFYCAAITMPVLKPINADWAEFRAALTQAWGQATRLSNFATTAMYARDVRRTEEMEKLPPMPNINIYHEARAAEPGLPTGSLNSILHAVRGKYSRRRYDVIWTAAETLPNYKYPTPYPVTRDKWKPSFGDEGEPIVACRICDKRYKLQLRRGKGFRRQYAAFARAVRGEVAYTELALYRQRANEGDHRNGVESKENGGGGRQHHRIMCKVVLWLPKEARDRRRNDGVLAIGTAQDCLLLAVDQDGREWRYHAEHARRWIAEHRRKLAALSDDRKCEYRRPRRAGLGEREYTDKICAKQRRRMKTLIDQVTAALANYARRRRIATVTYDDAARGYMESFAYAEMKTTLANKLNKYDIVMETASANETTKSD